ncbi:TonB-dependent receptor [Maricaulis sp. CAU 1757]
MYNSACLSTASALVLAVATATAGAAAQSVEAEGGVEVITVTTQFRSQSVADVPINLSAFDAGLIEKLDIESFEDLAAFTPGLLVHEQSASNTSYAIRGITTDSGEATSETRVAIFQDGVSINRARGSSVALFDIERFEVAKGPQPTLFGRGALIGGINIIQRKAEDTLSASLEAGFGNFDQREASGHVNLPLADNYALRVAGVIRQRAGYVSNAAGGEALQSEGMSAYRLVLSGAPTDRVDIDLILNYQHDTPSGTATKSGVIPVPGGDASPFTSAALQTFGDFMEGRPLGLDRRLRGVTLRADAALDDQWTLTAISGWRDFDALEVLDPDGSILPFLAFAEDASGEQSSQELRLSYDAGQRWTGSLGAQVFHETTVQRVPVAVDERVAQAVLLTPIAAGLGLSIGQVEALLAMSGFPGVDADNPFNPFAYSIPALLGQGQLVPLRGFYEEVGENASDVTSLDLFADATVELTSRLSLTGGLRWTREDKTSSGYGRNVSGPNFITFSPTLVVPYTPGGQPVSQSGDFDDLTWRAALSYRVSDDLNAWASLGRGRRPDVISVDTRSPSFFSEAPAEIVDSLEVGAFWNWRHGQFSGSVYYSEYENFQTSRFDPNQVSFITDNAGNATQYGAELQGRAYLGERADLYVSYAYNSATLDDTDGQGRVMAMAGQTFRYAPRHAASLGLDVLLIDAAWGELSFRPTWNWQSRVYFDNDNSLFGGALSQGEYGVVDARLRYEDARRPVHVELHGSNLLDEEYLIDAGNTGGTFGLPTFVRGAPRLYGIRIGYTY